MIAVAFNRIAVPLSYRDIWTAAFLSNRQVASSTLRSILCAFLGLQDVEFFSAGRYALYDFLKKLDPARPEVITPAFGCAILPTVIAAAGRIPVLADIHPGRFCIESASLEAKLTARTGAVILVHEFGVPVARDVVMRARSWPGVLVIEDMAVAMGATYADGEPAGTMGDAALLSGGAGKPVSAWSFGALGLRKSMGMPSQMSAAHSWGSANALRVAITRALGEARVFGCLHRLIDMLSTVDSEHFDLGDSRAAPTWFDLVVMAR